MLFFHDVRRGSGWAPGLHFTLSSLVDLQPGPSPASDQLVTGGGEKSPSRTCDHTRDCTHAAHAAPGRCTPPLQPLGEAPEWPLGSWPRPGGRGREEQGSSPEATAGTACLAVSRYASLCGGHVLPGQTRSALLHRRPGDEKGAHERTTEAADTEGWHSLSVSASVAPKGVSWSALAGTGKPASGWSASTPAAALTLERGWQAWIPLASPVLPPALPFSLGSFAAGLSSTH